MTPLTVFYCDHFVLPLPDGHRFPMEKYRALRERIDAQENGNYRLVEPHAAGDDQLTLAHSKTYVAAVASGALDRKAQRELGFPWSPQLVERARRSVGATIAAGRAALDSGLALSLAGGTHHAHRDKPQGFCVFNDAVVAARVLQREAMVSRVVVVDCDVHQGNGTAAMVENDTSIFTFSIHGARNFPLRKAVSDLDIALDDGCGDEAYLDALGEALAAIRQRISAQLVIYLAGADPYAGDRLGKLSLTKSGLRRRDQMVMQWCRQENMPCVVTMAGGYANNVDDIVDIHFATVETAWQLLNGIVSPRPSGT